MTKSNKNIFFKLVHFSVRKTKYDKKEVDDSRLFNSRSYTFFFIHMRCRHPLSYSMDPLYISFYLSFSRFDTKKTQRLSRTIPSIFHVANGMSSRRLSRKLCFAFVLTIRFFFVYLLPTTRDLVL